MTRVAGLIATLALAAMAGESRWLPVEPGLLTMMQPRQAPDAGAEMIFKQVTLENLDDSGTARLSFYVRVKLYNAAGVQEWSIVSLVQEPFVDYKDIAARTTGPDGAVHELEKADIVERKIVKGFRKGLTAKSFAVPAATPGSVVEYRYTRTARSTYFVLVEVQEEIPVWHFSLTGPPNKTFRSYASQPGMRREITKDKRLRLIQENIPGLAEEPGMPPELRVRSIAGVTVVEHDGFITWDTLGSIHYQDFEKATRPSRAVRVVAEELTLGMDDGKAKLLAIERYCRTKVQNLRNASTSLGIQGMKSWKASRSPEQTLERRLGTSTEVNHLFASLARAAGFEVYPIAIADREWLPPVQSDPLMGEAFFIARSVAVRVEGEWHMYDPATPHLAAGTLRWQEQGTTGAIFGPNTTTFVDTPPAKASLSGTSRTGDFTLEENGVLRGYADLEYTGHLAAEQRARLVGLSPEEQRLRISDGLRPICPAGQWAVEKLESLENAEVPLKVRVSVHCPDYAAVTGKRLLISAGVFQHNAPAKFTEAKRTHPVWIPFGWTESDTVAIRLPDGYTVENPTRPYNVSFKPVGGYEVSLAQEDEGRRVVFTRRYEFGTHGGGSVDPERYPVLKRIFDTVHAQDTMVVSLAKAAQVRK